MRIQADQIGFDVGRRRVIHDRSLEVPSGTSLAIIGASGSGKTTLLNCLSLLLPASRGTIQADGRDITGLRGEQRRRFWAESTAFVFQDYGLVPEESVGYNVSLTTGWLRRKVDPAVADALERVGLADRVNDPIEELSGGEKQRVGIARAIHKKASLIFADEPTASLDETNRRLVQELLLSTGATVIAATHDSDFSRSCAQRLGLEIPA